MATLIYVLLPLVLSGLGFLSYQHPVFTRKITYFLFGIGAIIYSLIFTYNTAQIKENAIIKYEVNEVKIPYPKILKNGGDTFSLESPLERNHYLTQIVKDNQKELSVIMYVNERETKQKEDIYSRIDNKTNEIEGKNSDLYTYSIAALVIIVVLHLLTFPFEKIQNKKSIKANNSPPKASL